MSIKSLVRELEDYCEHSRALSLEGLRERIRGIPPDAVRDSAFFHYACYHDEASLEIIECLLSAFPEAAHARTSAFCPVGKTTAYPIHLACRNASCPTSAIQLLAEKNISALHHQSLLDTSEGFYVFGLPLHLYLSRSGNLDPAAARMLVEVFPEAATTMGARGWSPLHLACMNNKMDPRIVRMLLDRWPESVNHLDDFGDLPLHYLANAEDFRESAAEDVLELLLDASPQSAREWVDGKLPIHSAVLSLNASDEFCRMLIDAYPESLGMRSDDCWLPIHLACHRGRSAGTVKYMLERDPQSISIRDGNGDLPIHLAAQAYHCSGGHKVEIIKHLLKKDPDCASKPGASQRLPLHLACDVLYRTACIESVRILFDAYPEAIGVEAGNGRTPLDIARGERHVAAELVEFLETQLVYARQAEGAAAMFTPDQNGWLPLHHALRDNASLGAIKLLLKGNPSALRVASDQLSFPMHIACAFSTADVVQFLLTELGDDFLYACDAKRDSTLHYACRGCNLGVVKYLLERRVPSVSEPNIEGKLPIHLLWDSDEVDRQSLEYVEANWLLLLAYPETVSY